MGYLIGSFQVCHHHLNLIGPEEDTQLLQRKTTTDDVTLFKKRLAETHHTNRNKEWINADDSQEEKYTLHSSHVCVIVWRAGILENASAVSIKLLSKFHLNPLIVTSITQTACMCTCIHVFKSVCMCVFLCVWVCTCKPLNPGHTKTEGLH